MNFIHLIECDRHESEINCRLIIVQDDQTNSTEEDGTAIENSCRDSSPNTLAHH